MIDKIFKIGLLVLAFFALLVFIQKSRNDRYQFIIGTGVFDKRTGSIFTLDESNREFERADEYNMIKGFKRQKLIKEQK